MAVNKKKSRDFGLLAGLNIEVDPFKIDLIKNSVRHEIPGGGYNAGNVIPSTIAVSPTAGRIASLSVASAAIEVASVQQLGRVTGLTPIKTLAIGTIEDENKKTIAMMVEAKQDTEDGEVTVIAKVGNITKQGELPAVSAIVYKESDSEETESEWVPLNPNKIAPIAVLAGLIYMMPPIDATLAVAYTRIKTYVEALINGGGLTAPDKTICDEALMGLAVYSGAIEAYSKKKNPLDACTGEEFTPINLGDITRGKLKPNGTIMPGSCFDVLTAPPGGGKAFGRGSKASGQYSFHPDRVFSDYEKSLIPQLDETIEIPGYVADHAKLIRDCGFRDGVYEGPPGSGKTISATAMAALLGLPHIKVVFNANTTAENVTGYYAPRTQKTEESPISYADAQKMNPELPDIGDMAFDPLSAYKTLTGKERTEQGGDPSPFDCLTVCVDKVVQTMALAKNDRVEEGGDFVFIKSQIAEAVEHGWLVELQEVSAISNGATLKLLNQLLDDSQQMELPNGEIIKRHPDTVIIFTANSGSDCDNEMDNSLRDRVQFFRTVEMPSVTESMKRVQLQSGYSEQTTLKAMVETVNEMRSYLKSEDRNYYDRIGMRSLINWAKAVLVTKEFEETCEATVIQKITASEDVQESLRNIYKEHEADLVWKEASK